MKKFTERIPGPEAAFGERLRWLRLARGLTLDAFGERVAVAKSYLCHLEKGERGHPSRRVIELICDRMNVTQDWLLFGKGEKQRLTVHTENGVLSSVQSQMNKLLDRLSRATARRGMKSALARSLGVPQQNVSDWLLGKREPGGETTLRLLQWVEAEERKQQSPGDDANTTGAKTQPRRVSYEKPKSGPKER